MDLDYLGMRRIHRLTRLAGATKGMASKLVPLLACTRALAVVAQSYHWRTEGESYYSDHLLFERIYGAANDMIDGLAEKIVGLCGDGSLVEINLQTKLISELVESHSPPDTKSEAFPASLLAFTEHSIDCIKKVLEELKGSDSLSDGLEDMLQGIASKHEEHVYLLQRRIGE